MQEYPVKRSHQKELRNEYILALKEIFGVEPTPSGGGYEIAWGALKRLHAEIGHSGKTLVVETESDLGAGDEAIMETNRRFRRYLDRVTGYTTKERVKLAKKEVEDRSDE